MAAEEGDEGAKARAEAEGEEVFAEVRGEDEDEAAALDEGGEAGDAEGQRKLPTAPRPPSEPLPDVQ